MILKCFLLFFLPTDFYSAQSIHFCDHPDAQIGENLLISFVKLKILTKETFVLQRKLSNFRQFGHRDGHKSELIEQNKSRSEEKISNIILVSPGIPKN